MKANEVLRKFFKKHGVKQLAEILGLSEPFLYKWCQPDGGKASGGWNPVERVAALTEAMQDEMLLEYLCARAGFIIVRSGEMPPELRRWLTRAKAEMKQTVKSALVKPAAGCSHDQPGGSRCRHRRADGRCGYPHAARN